MNLCVRNFLPDTLSPNNDRHAQPQWVTSCGPGDHRACSQFCRFLSERPATPQGGMPSRLKTYHSQKRKRHNQQRRQIRPNRTFLATPLLALSSLIWEATIGQWLIADLSVSDIHFQAWMLLVAGIVLLWFLYVLATR